MEKYDCIVIGGGIAGITASIYLKNANKKVLLIEKSALGGLLNKISKIENYPGFKSITGPDFAFSLYEQIKANDISFINDTVIGIDSKEDGHHVLLKDKVFLTRFLILATGREARKLNLPNEDKLIGKGVSYCALCDGPFYKQKDVCVIGAGDSALLEALYLANICHHVTIINKYSQFKGKEKLLEEVQKTKNISILYDSLTSSLNTENNLLKSITITRNQKQEEIKTSGVFVYIGSTPNIFSNLKIELDKNYIKVNQNMQTSLDTIYAVGDVIKKDIYQLINAASEGMQAAISIIQRLNKE